MYYTKERKATLCPWHIENRHADFCMAGFTGCEISDVLMGRKVTPRRAAQIEIEARIVRRIVKDALAQGYKLRVDDGGDDLIDVATVKAAMDALMNTDDDTLHLSRGKEGGWVRFVYGNEPWYVVSDYTLNLESVMTGANALAERIEAEKGGRY